MNKLYNLEELIDTSCMNDIKRNFLELIENKNWKSAKYALIEMDANDVVQILQDLPQYEKLILFRLLSRARAKQVFKLLTFNNQLEIVNALEENPKKVANLLNDIEPDDR